MLYDPKWTKQPSFLTMANFCESKPADETYSFMNCWTCACAQFSHTMGMGGDAWLNNSTGSNRETWLRLNEIARETPWTFGALAARLRQEI